MTKIEIPLSVPAKQRAEYLKNYKLLTNNSGRLFLVAGDQRVEHLNDDFVGPGISPDDASPEHLFVIARSAPGGVLATHPGLIARYGAAYPEIPYIVKINGKTHLGNNEAKDSSQEWWTIDNIKEFKKQSGLKIVGIGYTVYLGGAQEAKMLTRAARLIQEAHQAGLTAVIWMYPRGPKINEEDVHIIAGGAGVAASLNADFVKVKYPAHGKNPALTAKKFQEVVKAAGKTKIVCAFGAQKDIKNVLSDLDRQINISGVSGLAIGRNLHQRSEAEAARLSQAISALLFEQANADQAYRLYQKKLKPKNEKTSKNSRFLGLF